MEGYVQQRMALLSIYEQRGPWPCQGSMLQCRGMPGQAGESGYGSTLREAEGGGMI